MSRRNIHQKLGIQKILKKNGENEKDRGITVQVGQMEEYTLCGLEMATSARFMIVGYIPGNGDFCQIYDCWVYPRKW